MKDIDIPGFYSAQIYAKKKRRRGRPKQGVSIYYNDKVGKLLDHKFLESTIIIKFELVEIIAAYYSPNLSAEEVQDEMLLAFQHVENFEKLIFTGDFNSRIDDKAKDRKGKSLLEIAEWNDLSLVNTFPLESTYVFKKGSSVIDLMFTGSKIRIKNFEVVESCLRKHRPITAKIEIECNHNRTKCSSKIIHKIDENRLRENLETKYNILISSALEENDIEKFYDLIKSLIKNSKKEVNVNKRKSKPWFDAQCHEFKNGLDEVRFLSKNFPCDELNSILSSLKRRYRELIKFKKHTFEAKKEQSILEEAVMFPYKVLSLNNKCKYIENKIDIEHCEIYYEKILNKRGFKENDSLNLKDLLIDYSSDIEFKEISHFEVSYAISKLKNKKSPGPDLITNENLKSISKELIYAITAFFNICLKSGKMPLSWKYSNMNLLYKGKGDKLEISSYRGICLGNTLFNLLDRILNLRIYAATEHLIPQNQYGFTKNRSTIGAVSDLKSKIKESLNTAKGHLYAAFLDLKRAFDSGDRAAMFKNLIDQRILSKQELILIADMLDLNYVKINDGVCTSANILQSNGYRQGGCTSPLFFNFSIHDINNVLEKYPEVKLILYADDMVLMSKDLNQVKLVILDLIEYLKERNLELNFNKCKIVKFRNGGPRARSDELFINGHEIEFVSSFCYLGVTFQTTGKSFKTHIKNRARSAMQATFEIKNLCKLSLDTAIKLFHIKIAPIASYGIEVIWENLNSDDFEIIESVKTRYLKKVLSVSKYAKSRFVYLLCKTGLFVEELKQKFDLPNTPQYNKFYDQYVKKSESVSENFYNTSAMLNESWKQLNFENRHVETRFSCHGFHHLICNDKSYHEAGDECTCSLCGLHCSQYHLKKCTKRINPISFYAKMS